MVSSKRRIRRKQCDGKIRHKTKEDAHSARYSLQKKTGEWLRIYKCKFCGGWHVGHPSARRDGKNGKLPK